MGKKRRLPILHVVQVGNPQFERYLIEDEKERVWTGHEFGQPGVLFADHNQAATEVQTILKSHFPGVGPVKYTAPVVIEVYSPEPIDVAQVAMYLSACSKLRLNTAEHGNGPGTSLVLPMIDWSRIEQVKESPNE